jgi:hypothetical protein
MSDRVILSGSPLTNGSTPLFYPLSKGIKETLSKVNSTADRVGSTLREPAGCAVNRALN